MNDLAHIPGLDLYLTGPAQHVITAEIGSTAVLYLLLLIVICDLSVCEQSVRTHSSMAEINAAPCSGVRRSTLGSSCSPHQTLETRRCMLPDEGTPTIGAKATEQSNSRTAHGGGGGGVDGVSMLASWTAIML